MKPSRYRRKQTPPLNHSRVNLRRVIFDAHAMDRWGERARDMHQTMEDALAESIPYGAQYGNNAMFLNEQQNVVFVIRYSPEKNRPVVCTVLTREQAQANVENIFNHSAIASRS